MSLAYFSYVLLWLWYVPHLKWYQIEGIIDQLICPPTLCLIKITIIIRCRSYTFDYHITILHHVSRRPKISLAKLEGRELTFTTCENKQQLNLYHHLAYTTIRVWRSDRIFISRAMTIDRQRLYWWVCPIVLQLQFIIIDDDMHINVWSMTTKGECACTICNRPWLLQIDKPLLLSNTNNQIDVRPTLIPIALGGGGGEADRRLLIDNRR